MLKFSREFARTNTNQIEIRVFRLDSRLMIRG
jgi:hypothetical protein